VVEVVVLRAFFRISRGPGLLCARLGFGNVSSRGDRMLLAVVLPDQHEQRERQARREADGELAPACEIEPHATGARSLEIPAGDFRGQARLLHRLWRGNAEDAESVADDLLNR